MMHHKISLSINNAKDIALLDIAFEYIQKKFEIHKVENLHEAFEEVISNVLHHAYQSNEQIHIKVHFNINQDHIRIDIDEMGRPFDFSRYLKEGLDHSGDHSKGFYRVYDLVELFYFSTLSDQTKRFSLIQPLESYNILQTQKNTALNINKKELLSHLDIRIFEDGDGEGIAQLIYHNYDYTYYKSHYYDPQKIRESNHLKESISIVAKYHHNIIGHFALIPSKNSPIAEIAVAVVDPKFKRMGIMNAMFDAIIEEAKKMKFLAIYGEGMMMHPYSQKANLSHGMIESAIVMGEVPSVMEIEHKIKDNKRSGVIMAFLLFEKNDRYLRLPSHYQEQIFSVYREAEISLHVNNDIKNDRENIRKTSNSLLNIGVIIIEDSIDERSFKGFLDEMLCEHHDMIFADINLHHILEIDTLIALLHKYRFFYSGVLFNFYFNEDYLRLQRKNSHFVDEEHLICYSNRAKRLMEFILKDKEWVTSV
jgi:hypothetical protein